MIVKGVMNPEKFAIHTIAELFKDVGVVAGGCVVSAYNNTRINDIDLFLIKPISLNEVVKRISPYYISAIVPRSGEPRYSQYFELSIPTIFGDSIKVDLNVVSKGDKSLDDVLYDFDMTNCMVWWDIKTSRPNGLLHSAKLGSAININKCKHPVKLLERVAKYQAKGYRITDITKSQLNQVFARWYYEHPEKERMMDTVPSSEYIDDSFAVMCESSISPF
jgi:hypothetical protein